LDHCQEKLSQIKKGTLKVDYFEGMACQNGCVDGPGALAQFGLARVLLAKFAEGAEKKTSDENPEARRLAEMIRKQTAG
jgi:iron only hydrogenase large subunit-like protein